MKSTMRKLVAWMLVLVLSIADTCAFAVILELPESLTIIDEEAFYGTDSIDEVLVHDEVTEIRSKAFADSSLTEINLPGSIEYIADDAFDGCEDVAVTAEQGTYAFDWAVEKGYIKVAPAENFEYIIEDGTATITKYIGTETDTIIPATLGGYPVTSIGEKAFLNRIMLTSISIPKSVTSIGDGAFWGCGKLTSISLP